VQTDIKLMSSPLPLARSRLPEATLLPDRDGREYLPQAYRLPEGEARGPIVQHLPRVVFIEVTNHCNLLCQTCPRTFASYEEPKTLSWEDFLQIVEQFPDMQRAVLHGIGEPLLNRDLPRMIAHLKIRGVTVLFNTNATLLDDEWSRKLITSSLDELRVSVDGADPRTYALIRGAPVFHKVVRNLKRFIEIQREIGAGLPRASLWMTGMKENIAELPGVIHLAAHVGVPEVYLQRMVYYLDEHSPPGMMGSGHGLFGSYDTWVDQIIADAEALARELGVTLRASGATDPRRSLAADQRDPRPWTACLRPWTTAYVTANGNCLPCCISPFATQDYQSLILGNLFDQAFSDIWNDEHYQRWRTTLLSDHPPTTCAGCGACWSL
jgi:MoaA/NifB/PqqE/SkfB family radical SAM enzyme